MTKIVVYDTDPKFSAVLKAALTSLSYEAVVAADGYSILPLAEQHRPALIILDYKPPETDGYAILQRLRKSAACAATPVIFASVTPKFEIEFIVTDAPSVGYVDKPLNVSQLKDAIEALIGPNRAAPRPAAAPTTPAAPAPAARAFTGEVDLDGTRDDVLDLD